MFNREKDLRIFKYSLALLYLLLTVMSKLMEDAAFHPTLFVWLGPIAVLLLTKTAKTKLEYVAAYLVYIISANIEYYGFFSGITGFAMITALQTVFFIPFVVDRILQNRLPGRFIACMAFPFLTVSVELLYAVLHVEPMFAFALELFNSKAIVQSTALIGIFGLEFVLAFNAEVIAFAAVNGISRARGALAANIAVIFALALFGEIRMQTKEDADESIRVAYMAGMYVGSVTEGTDFWEPEYDESIASFDAAAKTAGESGVELMVFAEEAFTIQGSDENKFVDHARDAAVQYDMAILLTMNHKNADENGKGENKLLYIDRDGVIRSEYLKYKLIPILEMSDNNPGDGQIPTIETTIDGKTVSLAFMICYDSDFSGYVASMRGTADCLIIPSWDWEPIEYLHNNTTGLRAIENGFTLFKPTYDGCTVVVDRYGDVSYTADTDDTGFETVCFVDLPINSAPTVYSVIAPYLNAIYPVGALIMIALVFMNKNARKKAA